MTEHYEFDTLPLPGTYVGRYKFFPDERGFFEELYNATQWPLFQNGIKQVSRSHSKKNVWRGLHLQVDPPMAKAMRIVSGDATQVLVDMHPLSQTYLHYYLTDILRHWIIAEPWIARGFITRADTVIEYLQTETVNEAGAYAIDPFDARFRDLGERMSLLTSDPKRVIKSTRDSEAIAVSVWEQTPWVKQIEEKNDAPKYIRVGRTCPVDFVIHPDGVMV